MLSKNIFCLLFFILWPQVIVAAEFETVIFSHSHEELSEIVIQRQDWERMGAASLSQALLLTSSVQILSPSPEFPLPSVFINGVSADQILVVLDGMPLNDLTAPGGAFDFSLVPLFLLEKIRVIPSGQGVRFGQGALGAVIVLESRVSERPGVNIKVGTPESVKVSLSGPVSATATMGLESGWARTKSLVEDPARAPEADQTRTQSFYWKHESEEFRHWVLGNVQSLDLDSAPGREDLNFKARNEWMQLGISHQKNFDKGSLQTQLGYSRQNRKLSNLPDDYLSDRYTGDFQSELVQIRSQWLQQQNWGSFELGLELEQQKIDFKEQYFPSAKEAWETHLSRPSTFVITELNPQNPFQVGARWSCEKDCDSFFNFQKRWERGIALSAELGGKEPTPYQRQSLSFGNLNLKNEKSQTLRGDFKKGGTQAAVSLQKFQDLIQFQSTRYENTARAEILALHFSQRIQLEPWTFQASYSNIEAKDSQTGLGLVRRPRHNYGFEMGRGSWFLAWLKKSSFQDFEVGGSRVRVSGGGMLSLAYSKAPWSLVLQNPFQQRAPQSPGYRPVGANLSLNFERLY
ncbi:MAG: TonB-dependent receptor plug domain-containing protein [Pseudobdellovibrionaceae bacterium]